MKDVQVLSLGEEQAALPPVDVYETDDAFVVECDLPGARPEILKVSLCGTTVTLECPGRPPERRPGELHRFHCVERSPESFVRRITLPGPVCAGECSALYENGVLTLRLGKMQERRGRRITIPVKTK